jgi:hypothetical protein
MNHSSKVGMPPISQGTKQLQSAIASDLNVILSLPPAHNLGRVLADPDRDLVSIAGESIILPRHLVQSACKSKGLKGLANDPLRVTLAPTLAVA